MFIGIDIGTSSVKGVLLDEDDRVLAEESEPLEVERPRQLWCEQSPETWWTATTDARAQSATSWNARSQASPISSVAEQCPVSRRRSSGGSRATNPRCCARRDACF